MCRIIKTAAGTFLLSLLTLGCAQNKDPMVGKWKIKSINDKIPQDSTDTNIFYEFKDNHQYIGINGSDTEIGTWRYYAGVKELVMKDAESHREDILIFDPQTNELKYFLGQQKLVLTPQQD